MGRALHNAYLPNAANHEIYNRLYAEYSQLHDYFGRGTNDVLHRLHDLRIEASAP